MKPVLVKSALPAVVAAVAVATSTVAVVVVAAAVVTVVVISAATKRSRFRGAKTGPTAPRGAASLSLPQFYKRPEAIRGVLFCGNAYGQRS